MRQSDLVTIVTPSYNSSKFIGETIESAIVQTYTEWEMIIVDDCSTDNSIDIVNEYQNKDSRIKLIQLAKNSGPALARNRAIEEARGRYISFLDSDDLWSPEKLAKQISFINDEDVALSYTGYQKIDEKGTPMGYVHVPLKVNYNKILRSNYIACSTAIYDVVKLGKVYMPDILKRQDHGLWLKILRTGCEAHGIDEPLGYYRVRSASISSNKMIAAKYQWKLYREVEELSFFHSIYYFLHYAYKGFLKYIN